MTSITIGSPFVRTEGGRVIYSVETRGYPGVDRLWFSIPAEAESFVNSRADAAVVALLMPLMKLGLGVTVESPLTSDLGWNLQGDVQHILRRVRPELSPIEIRIDSPVAPHDPAAAVATGYSAGVDSYATLARHHFSADAPESVRVTHLLYNNVGSHGHGERGRSLYRSRLDLLRPNALSTGLPLIDVDSNIDDFFLAAGLAFQPSHTIRNASVVHLLAGGIRHYLYASSVPYEDVASAPRFDLGFADPVLLPFLSTRSLTLQSSGTDMDRSAKTALIADLPHTYDRLDVCVTSTDGTNCSECWKCQRTMLTLELIGALDRYSGVFTSPRNPRWREDHLAEAMTQDMPSARSLVALYDRTVGVSPALRARAFRRSVASNASRVLRAVERRMERRR